MRIHYYLEIDEDKKIRCMKCRTVICDARDNYKLHVPSIEKAPSEIPGRRPSKPEFATYYEYYCPGCHTLLAVESRPRGTMPIHDIQIKI